MVNTNSTIKDTVHKEDKMSVKILLTLALGLICLLILGCEREITGNVELADNSSELCFDCHDGANDLGTEVVLATRQWETSAHLASRWPISSIRSSSTWNTAIPLAPKPNRR